MDLIYKKHVNSLMEQAQVPLLYKDANDYENFEYSFFSLSSIAFGFLFSFLNAFFNFDFGITKTILATFFLFPLFFIPGMIPGALVHKIQKKKQFSWFKGNIRFNLMRNNAQKVRGNVLHLFKEPKNMFLFNAYFQSLERAIDDIHLRSIYKSYTDKFTQSINSKDYGSASKIMLKIYPFMKQYDKNIKSELSPKQEELLLYKHSLTEEFMHSDDYLFHKPYRKPENKTIEKHSNTKEELEFNF